MTKAKQASTSRGRGVPRSGEARAKGAPDPLMRAMARRCPACREELRDHDLMGFARCIGNLGAVKRAAQRSVADMPRRHATDADVALHAALSRLARAARRSP